jgi:hypothetical protein
MLAMLLAAAAVVGAIIIAFHAAPEVLIHSATFHFGRGLAYGLVIDAALACNRRICHRGRSAVWKQLLRWELAPVSIVGLDRQRVYPMGQASCLSSRAINQMEKDWEKTLTGIPKEIYQLWRDYLQPRGYRIRYQIVDFPGGVPNDISITITWDA